MTNLNNLLSALIIGFAISSCGTHSGQKQNAESNDQDDMRLKQYMVKGRELYTLYCANCHQEDGTGLASLFPPLADSDYLLSDLERAACVIKKGLFDEITVNGKTYNQMMPANEQMAPLEVAEVLTYITNSWGNKKGLSNVKEVELWLLKCE
ncbi:MAG: cytochrome c [Cyclobacteriaceae bacterium]